MTDVMTNGFGNLLSSLPAQEERDAFGMTIDDQAKTLQGFRIEPESVGKLLGPVSQREATRNELFADATIKLDPRVQSFFDKVSPKFNQAVKVAEGNPTNFGVLSEDVDSPDEANQILNNSISNSFKRWLQAGRPGKFVSFFQQRWAPIGVENDPDDLNRNFVKNVIGSLKDQLSEDDVRVLMDNGIL